jgi:hypothetical protein
MAATQLNLFGEQVKYEDLGAFETTQAPCNEKCLRAHEKVCVCRCGGKNHGIRTKGKDHYFTLEELGIDGHH